MPVLSIIRPETQSYIIEDSNNAHTDTPFFSQLDFMPIEDEHIQPVPATAIITSYQAPIRDELWHASVALKEKSSLDDFSEAELNDSDAILCVINDIMIDNIQHLNQALTRIQSNSPKNPTIIFAWHDPYHPVPIWQENQSFLTLAPTSNIFLECASNSSLSTIISNGQRYAFFNAHWERCAHSIDPKFKQTFEVELQTLKINWIKQTSGYLEPFLRSVKTKNQANPPSVLMANLHFLTNFILGLLIFPLALSVEFFLFSLLLSLTFTKLIPIILIFSALGALGVAAMERHKFFHPEIDQSKIIVTLVNKLQATQSILDTFLTSQLEVETVESAIRAAP